MSRTVTMSQRTLLKHYDGFVRSLRHRRDETRGTYARALREFVRWAARGHGPRFRPEDVEAYKRHLIRGRKMSPVSVSTYLTALRQFCEYLVSIRVLKENPARQVEGFKRPSSHSREVLSQANLEMLYASVEGTGERDLRDYAFIRLMAGCGLSEIEIIRADVGDLRLTDAHATISVQGKGREVKDAIVTLSPDARVAIERYLAVRGGPLSHEPLFTSAGNRTRGERMTTRGVRDRVNHYLEHSGIKQGRLRKVTPYSLRHTAAVMMADAGATADEIKERMRLGSVATAMLYIHRKEQ